MSNELPESIVPELPKVIEDAWMDYAEAMTRLRRIPFGDHEAAFQAIGDSATNLRRVIAAEIARLNSDLNTARRILNDVGFE